MGDLPSSLLMVSGGALTLLLSLPILSLGTWLVLLTALLMVLIVHPTNSRFLLLLFARAAGEDINLAIYLLMAIGGALRAGQ